MSGLEEFMARAVRQGVSLKARGAAGTLWTVRDRVPDMTGEDVARLLGCCVKVAYRLLRELKAAGFYQHTPRPIAGGTRWEHERRLWTEAAESAPTRAVKAVAAAAKSDQIRRTKGSDTSTPPPRPVERVLVPVPDRGGIDPDLLHPARALAQGLSLPVKAVAPLAAAMTRGWAVGDLGSHLTDGWPVPTFDPVALMLKRLSALPPPPRPVDRDPALTDRPRRERLRPDPGWCGACGESTRRLLHRELARMVDCPACSPYVAGAA